MLLQTRDKKNRPESKGDPVYFPPKKGMQERCGQSGRVCQKIKNSISVPSHSDAIFSLGPSLQAEKCVPPNQHFQNRGLERELKFYKCSRNKIDVGSFTPSSLIFPINLASRFFTNA
jgi:hypothetical protein